jgi:group I intron endonuclease
MKTGIYCIQSVIKPARIYIGAAVNIERRWKDHTIRLTKGVHENIKLQNHFYKYGKDDLVFGLLTECKKEELLKLEQEFIDLHKPFFNICQVAGSSIGCKNPVNAAKKGNKNHFFGKQHTAESKKLNRDAHLGKKHSPEHNLNISKGHLGKKRSESARHNMCEAQKKIIHKPATKKTKEKMSESGKKAWIVRKQLKNNLCV